MKKALALILSLAMVLCLIPAVASADTTPIADVRAAAVGGTFTVEGIMTAKDGKSLYIQDSTGGIVVRLSDAYLDDALVDMKITATGTTGDYNGLLQLNAVSTDVTFAATTDTVTPVAATYADLANKIAQQVKLTNWEITKIDDLKKAATDTTAAEYYANPNITITDGTNTLMMYKSVVTKSLYAGTDGAAAEPTYSVGTKVDVIVTVDFNSGLRLRLDGDDHICVHEADDPTPPPTNDPTPPPAGDKNTEDLVILYSNDVHCGIGTEVYERPNGTEEDPKDKGAVVGFSGGYGAVAAIKKAQEAAYENVLLVDAGDHVQGAPIGTLSTGSYIVDIMNFVSYDLSAVGNHEFDYGMDRFNELKALAEYDYISANFMDLTTNEAALDAYKVFTFGDKKVAFVGLSTPETLTKSTPTFFQNAEGEWIYDFANTDTATFVATIQAAITAASAEADYVIALGHLGVDEASSPWTSKELIAAVSGLDAFIDGHSHSTVASELVKDKDNKDVTLTQTGTKLANLGKMILKADGTVTCELLPLKDVKVDEATDEKLMEIYAQYGAKLVEVVAHTNYNLVVNDPATDKRIVRSRETNLGDLCADAYLYQMEADIAFVNGGGVRAAIPAGDVAFGQILNVHPFGNMACLVEVTGQQVLDALEWGYSKVGVGENGGFLQVAGLTLEIQPDIPNGCIKDKSGIWTGHAGEYRVKNVKVGGEALDLTKTYKLASHNYMLKSQGDGFGMFGTKNVTILRDEVLIDNQVLINYIKNTLNGEVPAAYADPYGQGRIKINEPYTYTITGDTGYEADYTLDADGNLLWTAKMSDLGAVHFGSLQFTVTWDKTKLELKGYTANKMSFIDGSGVADLVSATCNTLDENGATQNYLNFEKACTFSYALGSGFGAYLAPELNNVLVTIKFKVKDTVEDGERMNLDIADVKCSLVTLTEETISAETYTIGSFDGFIIAGKKPIDKDALKAEIAKDNGLMAGVVVSTDGKDQKDGTKWLTAAEKAANEAALAAAQAVVDKEDATQAEVDAALTALTAAFVAPKTAAVDTDALAAAIARAEATKADEAKWGEYSEEWQKKVEEALAAAKALIDNADATQNAVDAAKDALINALEKTGESMTVVVFAGIAILAMMGLAVVVRRRFN